MTKNLSLTPEDLQTLASLIDAGIRAGGWNAAKVAAPLIAKIEALAQDAPKEDANDPA